jgi:hypothetical protein
MLGSIAWQVIDRSIHNLFRPGEYFAYFTIQSSLIAALALLLAGRSAIQSKAETRALTLVRLSAVTSAVVVAIVYNLLLRDSAPLAADIGYEWPVPPNEILHVWAPILILVDWLLASALVQLKIKSIFWVLVFPLAWLIFSVVRGLATGWWPYWFIDPTGPGGVVSMVVFIFAIMFFLLLVALIVLTASRLTGRTKVK